MIKEAYKYRNKLIEKLDRAKSGKKFHSDSTTEWIGDISDHINLCNKIISGTIKTSNQLDRALWDLDTDSRDRIPHYIWKYANSYYE